jgi:hypothetical protein
MVAHASNHSYWQTQVGGLWSATGKNMRPYLTNN